MKIALIGYGKMGKAIEQLAVADGHEITGRFDLENKDELTAEALMQADVAIEFSTPDTVRDHILLALQAHVPIVVGTTGWYDLLDEIKQACAQVDGALLYASNFSIGVFLLRRVNQLLAELMNAQPGYTPSITETHHTEKLDAPSGTAITLANEVVAGLDRIKGWTADEPAGDQLHITSHRKDNIPGQHTVQYHSAIDDITISHEAHSREGFARGALTAASWIIAKHGVYELSDMIDDQTHQR